MEDIRSGFYGDGTGIYGEYIHDTTENFTQEQFGITEYNFLNAKQPALRSIITPRGFINDGATVKEWNPQYGGIVGTWGKSVPINSVVEDIIKLVNQIDEASFLPLKDMIAIMSPEIAWPIKQSGFAQEGKDGDSPAYFIPTEAGNLQIITHPLMGERYNRGGSNPNIYLLDASKWEFCCTFNMPYWEPRRGLYESLRLTNYAAFKCTQINPSWMRIKTREECHKAGWSVGG
ncbi:MAG: hypothetical protein OXC45_05350 [Gemmatimonadetes bacterium]|nr:hypothetical protein [Gemmatimonadota bacterium]